ncbi:hypothetical protein D3C77_578720 [compost metagenome]
MQVFEQRRQVGDCRCGRVGLQQGEGFLRVQCQAQVELAGQFGTCIQALLAAIGLGMAELLEHLPEQQREQQQNQDGQRAFERATQGRTGRTRGFARG